MTNQPQVKIIDGKIYVDHPAGEGMTTAEALTYARHLQSAAAMVGCAEAQADTDDEVAL